MTSDSSARPGTGTPYGAFDLQRLASRYLMIALGVSVAIHAAILCLYFLVAGFVRTPPQVFLGTRGPRTIDIAAPSVTWPLIPPARAPGPQASPRKMGLPVPVPAPEASASNEFPTQKELSREGAPSGEVGTGETSPTTTSAIDPEDTPPPAFVPVERLPVIIHSAVPVYPVTAARAELEGRVIVNVWVDRQGKPRQVRIFSSTNDMFNESALDAASKYSFVPAYMNAGPVPVWVRLAFNFRLK